MSQMGFKKRAKNIAKGISEKRLGIFSAGIAVIITAAFFVSIHYFGAFIIGALGIVAVVLWSVFLVTIMILAGFEVLKALFLVAAELSLLIFLAQSYCVAGDRAAASDESLKSLLVMGLLYIAVSFFRSLYKELKRKYVDIEKERWSKEKIVTVSSFLIMTVLFIWEIYQVVRPIVVGLCVFAERLPGK